MTSNIYSHLDLEELLDIIEKVDRILLVRESFEQLPPLSRVPIRLNVWAQDFNYQLNRLSTIKEEMVNEVREKCGNLGNGHEWKEDHVEIKNGEEMRKIIYCDRCLQMK